MEKIRNPACCTRTKQSPKYPHGQGMKREKRRMKQKKRSGVRAKKNAKLPTIGQDDSFITSLSLSLCVYIYIVHCTWICQTQAPHLFIYLFGNLLTAFIKTESTACLAAELTKTNPYTFAVQPFCELRPGEKPDFFHFFFDLPLF